MESSSWANSGHLLIFLANSDCVQRDAVREKSDQNRSNLDEIVYRFLPNRIACLPAGDGFSKDRVAADLNYSRDHIPQTWSRVRAIENLKFKPDFEPIVLAFN